jgi:hypothetical protein
MSVDPDIHPTAEMQLANRMGPVTDKPQDKTTSSNVFNFPPKYDCPDMEMLGETPHGSLEATTIPPAILAGNLERSPPPMETTDEAVIESYTEIIL